MIFFDVETTGLISNYALPLAQQPCIIELGALKTDEIGATQDTFSALVRPFDGKPLPPIITKITGLTDAELIDEPIFIELYGALAAFFRGERVMLAHNAIFDWQMLQIELRRVAKEYAFPWCSEVIDTRSKWPGKLQEWGKKVRGAEYIQAHRALDDCRLLRDCWFAEQ